MFRRGIILVQATCLLYILRLMTSPVGACDIHDIHAFGGI
jgi:hypothetical protein